MIFFRQGQRILVIIFQNWKLLSAVHLPKKLPDRHEMILTLSVTFGRSCLRNISSQMALHWRREQIKTKLHYFDLLWICW